MYNFLLFFIQIHTFKIDFSKHPDILHQNNVLSQYFLKQMFFVTIIKWFFSFYNFFSILNMLLFSSSERFL